MTEDKIEGSEKERVKKTGLCGIFRYRSMQREIVNFNEHKPEENEDEFLKSLLVAFPQQAYDEEYKLQVEFRHTGNLEHIIMK